MSSAVIVCVCLDAVDAENEALFNAASVAYIAVKADVKAKTDALERANQEHTDAEDAMHNEYVSKDLFPS